MENNILPNTRCSRPVSAGAGGRLGFILRQMYVGVLR